MRRLAALADAGRLGSGQVRSAAGALGVSERTVWRWVGQARAGEGLDRRPRGRFQVTGEVRQRLAFWRGNAAAVHRELAAAAKAGGLPAPSLSTLQGMWQTRVTCTRVDSIGTRFDASFDDDQSFDPGPWSAGVDGHRYSQDRAHLTPPDHPGGRGLTSALTSR